LLIIPEKTDALPASNTKNLWFAWLPVNNVFGNPGTQGKCRFVIKQKTMLY